MEENESERKGEEETSRSPWTHVFRVIFGLVVAGIFTAALFAIRRELSAYKLQDVVAAIDGLGRGRVLASFGLTVLSYAALSGYDVLAVRSLKKPVATHRALFTAWLATAFTNTVGFGGLGGASIRYRLYGAWGLGIADITRVLFLVAVTFWTGFAFVAGPTLVLEPSSAFAAWRLSWIVRPIGLALLGLAVAYVVSVLLRVGPLRLFGFELHLPRPSILPWQAVVSVADWFAASAVLWNLLPPGARPPLPVFLGVFLVAQLAGLLSHVPGGLGVFDAIVLGTFSGNPTAVAGSLLVYRGAYYVTPLVAAAIALTVREALAHRRVLGRAAAAVGQVAGVVVPNFVTAMVFLVGALLLVTSAMPSTAAQVRTLRSGLPSYVLELSHFLTSLIGAALLFLARGLQRRLDSAWLLGMVLLVLGVVVSALKAEAPQAIALIVMLAMLGVTRPYFHRRGSFIAQPFTMRWVTGIALVILASVWLGFFSQQHAELAAEPWWRIAFDPRAPRAVRAGIAAFVVLFLFGVAHVVSPGRHRPPPAAPEELEHAARLAAGSGRPRSWLALLGDKVFLFDHEGRGFVMFAVFGRTWISLGDPVGPKEIRRELVYRFRERAHREGGQAVFYEVGREDLELYLDSGMSLVKLGEEARVPVEELDLEGHAWASMRNVRSRLLREGCALEVHPPGVAAGLMDEIERISDAWLASKKSREKGFSMGRFDRDYLAHLPIAVVRCGGRPVAFASLWPGGREEIEIDLMRYDESAPRSVMDFLMVELMRYAHAEGYRWLNLGMAPFAGIEGRPPASLWHRLGRFLFRHGERFYGFEGVRRYKEKFHPVWEPRYLAVPRSTSVPRALTAATHVISGGFFGLVRP